MGTVLYKIAYGPRGMAIYNIGPKMWPKHWKCEKCRFLSFLCDFSECSMNLHDFYNGVRWEQYCKSLPMVPGGWPYILFWVVGPKKCPKHWKSGNVDFSHFYVILMNIASIYAIFITGKGGIVLYKLVYGSRRMFIYNSLGGLA